MKFHFPQRRNSLFPVLPNPDEPEPERASTPSRFLLNVQGLAGLGPNPDEPEPTRGLTAAKFLPVLQGFAGLGPILLLLSLALASPAQADPPPLPIDEYWQAMQETQALVASMEGAPSNAVRARLTSAADQWEAITEVALPDGTVIPVEHSFLAAQLRADPPDLAQLDHLLAALLAARDAWPQPGSAPADMGALDRILARPEFQWQPKHPSPLAELQRRLWERFWEFVARLLPGIATAELPFTLMRFALTGLGALALILVLVFAARGLLVDFVAEAEIDLENGIDEDLTAAAALKRAQALSGEGDYRTAVRYLYLSSLLLLEERGFLRYDRSLTNREYLRNVAHLPQLAATFHAIVEVFDRVWYGYQPLDETAYNRYAAQVEALRQQK